MERPTINIKLRLVSGRGRARSLCDEDALLRTCSPQMVMHQVRAPSVLARMRVCREELLVHCARAQSQLRLLQTQSHLCVHAGQTGLSPSV